MRSLLLTKRSVISSLRSGTAAMVLAAGMVGALAPASASAADHADAAATYKSIADTKAATVVTIKFVLKISMGGSDEERETEIPGVMIEPTGLIMASNLQLGGVSEAMRSFMAPGMSMTPKDIKVLVGDDIEGVDAKLIARDSELDLAWVQIEKKPETPYAAVDFATGKPASLGQTLFTVERLGKFFDRAPSVSDFRVGALPTKPRKLILAGERLNAPLGTPVFAADGTVVGVTILQLPSREEMEAEQGMMGGQRGVVVLPADQVVDAIKRAKEAAASGKPVDEPAAEAPMAEPAAPEQTPPPKSE